MMPDYTSFSSPNKRHQHKSKTTRTNKIDTPDYYYDYPSADRSLEERYQSSNVDYTTPASSHQPYQYQYFPHFYYPTHWSDFVGLVRQRLEEALNAQAQVHAQQQRQNEPQAAQQRNKSHNVYETQPQRPPVLQPPPQLNVSHMNNYNSLADLDGANVCPRRPGALQIRK